MVTHTGTAAQGWYFYGITRSGSPESLGAPLQLLEYRGLAAVVRRVRLDVFGPEALRERLQHASVLEEMVRSHNRVVDAIHGQRAILPAKFGVVHAHAEDVISGLRPAHDALVKRLGNVERCDEWAVHLYADRATVRERTLLRNASIQRLRDERDAARPGRAYFLEQQLHAALDAATEQELDALARKALDQLTQGAVAVETTPRRFAGEHGNEVEILRASFLVPRADTEDFENRMSAEPNEGLRYEYSGPWPPYSFAVLDEEEAR